MSKQERFLELYRQLEPEHREMVLIFLKILDLNQDMQRHFAKSVENIIKGGTQ